MLPLVDLGVDALREAEVVDRIVDSAASGQGGLVVTPNIDHLRQIHEGSWLGAVYADADLVVADGMPLLWAARLRGTPLPARVAGSDLLWSVSRGAARRGVSVYLLGGRPGAAERSAERLEAHAPGLRVVGTSCPPVGFERQRGGIDAIADHLRELRPGVVFTALGAPKQDILNATLRRQLPDMWFLGVGAAVDMAGGFVDPAPAWARNNGAEWVFRLAREPRRLARRYLVHGLPFATRLLTAAVVERRRSTGT